MASSIRIKATDQLKNVTYITNTNGEWKCNLAKGVPVSFSYAGINRDVMACIFDLEDNTATGTLEERRSKALDVVRKHGGKAWTYEIYRSNKTPTDHIAQQENV